MITREPRLITTERPARRDRLHGAWWPRNDEISIELPAMLAVAGSRFPGLIGVSLSLRALPADTPDGWPRPTDRPWVHWSEFLEPHVAILNLGGLRRAVLLVIPPRLPEDVALTATFMACAPGNSLSAAETLKSARHQVEARCSA